MSFSSDLIALNNKTNGKDKLFRTVQYSCKLIWYIMWKTKSNKDYVEILKKLESSMSNTRKVLRFGKSHEMIDNALKTIHIDDDFLRYILTFCNINQACYLLMDNILWLNSINILKLKKENASKINKWSNKFWLFASILYLARDFHDLLTLILNSDDDEAKKKFNPTNKYTLNENSGAYTSFRPNMRTRLRLINKLKVVLMNKKNHPLLLDTAKNVADIFLPLSSLEYIKLTPGLQGMFGLVSSLISLYIVWNPKYKLSP